jgi:hypothetical protein
VIVRVRHGWKAGLLLFLTPLNDFRQRKVSESLLVFPAKERVSLFFVEVYFAVAVASPSSVVPLFERSLVFLASLLESFSFNCDRLFTTCSRRVIKS